jgi:hypothetical protein
MENFKKNLKTAYNTKNLGRMISLVNNKNYGSMVPSRMVRAVLVTKFCELIASYGKAPILQKRNVEVKCIPGSDNSKYDFIIKFIDRANGNTIAELNCAISMHSADKFFFTTKISLGRTENRYSKSGNLRPTNNGPGYGTIIRAFFCAASKKLGAVAVTQSSSFLTNQNKAAALAGTLKQPVSAYIMNKLGFNKNTNRNVNNPLNNHTRVLFFKNFKTGTFANLPTPALNSVMSNIMKNRG